jgi:hypothetical protein
MREEQRSYPTGLQSIYQGLRTCITNLIVVKIECCERLKPRVCMIIGRMSSEATLPD